MTVTAGERSSGGALRVNRPRGIFETSMNSTPSRSPSRTASGSNRSTTTTSASACGQGRVQLHTALALLLVLARWGTSVIGRCDSAVGLQ